MRPRRCLLRAPLGLVAPLLLVGLASPALAQSRLLRAGDVDTMTLAQPGRRIAYGADSLQFGDLRLPATSGRAPLAIVIHGGCWIAGFASLRNAAPLADALASAGIATWNVEYRRTDSPGGGWPGTLHDVATAADYVRTLARLYPIDTTRIVLVGHSAGGQLALWLASRGRHPTPSIVAAGAAPVPVRGVVSIGGITDLREFATRQARGCGTGVAPLLGGAPDAVPERVREISPIERLPLGVPSVHLAGDADAIAPLAVREAYVRAAIAAGDDAVVQTVSGGHFEPMTARTDAGHQVVDAVKRLLGLPLR